MRNGGCCGVDGYGHLHGDAKPCAAGIGAVHRYTAQSSRQTPQGNTAHAEWQAGSAKDATVLGAGARRNRAQDRRKTLQGTAGDTPSRPLVAANNRDPDEVETL